MTTLFSSAQAARLTGLPAATLARWARTGLLEPAGGRRGGRWCWSFTDLLGLRVLSVLVNDVGLSTRRLRALLPALCRLTGSSDSLAALARRQLAVTGDQVLLMETEDAYQRLTDLFESPGQQVLGIFPLEQVVWDVQLAMKSLAEADSALAGAVTALRREGQWRVA